MNSRRLLPAAAMAAFTLTGAVQAGLTSYNSGSGGAALDATNINNPVEGLPGAVTAGGDTAMGYSGGSHTQINYQPALNPPSGSPFTIEFWAKPGTLVDDNLGPAPVFNRVSAGNRSGWVFFQRSPATGWNFRMYNGAGSAVGVDLTGGTANVDAWSHVVVTWDGAIPILYVNGLLADNSSVGNGVYNASTAANFSIGSYDDGANAFNGAIDETAFYGSALTPAQIQNHFNLATSAVPGAYSSAILIDGATLYLRNIPEPSSMALAALGLLSAGSRRSRRHPRR